MKVRAKILLGFLTIALIGGLIGFVGHNGSNNVFDSYDNIVQKTVPEIVILGEIESLSQKLQVEAVSHVLIETQTTGVSDDSELHEFEETNSELDAAISELKIIIDNNKFVQDLEDSKSRL